MVKGIVMIKNINDTFNEFVIKNLWRRSAGLPEIPLESTCYRDLSGTEWSHEFERFGNSEDPMDHTRSGNV